MIAIRTKNHVSVTKSRAALVSLSFSLLPDAMLLVVVVSLLAVAGSTKYTQSDCGREFVTHKPQERIHNGIRLSDQDFRFPWIVSLQFNVSNPNNPSSRKQVHHFCAASIIESEILLTAAHCAPDMIIREGRLGKEILEEPVRIVAGSLDWEEPDYSQHGYGVQFRFVKASDFIVHPDYKHTAWMHDMALIKIKNPFVMTPKVRSICLPPPHAMFQGLATIAGWGRTGISGFEQGPPRIQTAVVSLLPNKICSIYNDSYSADSTYCVGFTQRQGFRQACVGDSGGPLMVKMNDRSFVIGIVSNSMRCTGINPTIHERVTPKRNWIDRKIADLRQHKE
jgi:secreted trypsin-like serine protease